MLSIVVPVFNEEVNIRPFYAAISPYLPEDAELIWVDDGSNDHTLLEIADICKSDSRCKCISLSRNFGHQPALMAGLRHASGQEFILMDGDLQHPPELIPQLLNQLHEGFNIVQTNRVSTEKISWTKSISSILYYEVMNRFARVRLERNGADFRAFDRRVYDSLMLFNEEDPFLRGIFTWIGFKTVTISYHAPARKHGRSKYTFIQMLRMAMYSIISFSTYPLKLAFIVGFIVSLFAFAFIIFAIVSYFRGNTISGWTSIIIFVSILGGLQLLCVGIVGLYIGQLMREVKKRPQFIISRKINC